MVAIKIECRVPLLKHCPAFLAANKHVNGTTGIQIYPASYINTLVKI